MRIVHISDLHFWHVTLDPRRVWGKRFLGMANLVLNRAYKYRMETMPELVERIRGLAPDHVLVTGDLTTTALEEEFAAVRSFLAPLCNSPSTITVIPGNHDRYTRDAERRRVFERYFGEFAPSPRYPWLKEIGESVAILALDPCRPTVFSALGSLSHEQMRQAARLLESARARIRRLLIACHYPIALPAGVLDARGHGMLGRGSLEQLLSQHGPALYCHGHVHTAWAFVPASLPRVLCLDPGPALRRRRSSGLRASMLEIVLEGEGLEVHRHVLRRKVWESRELARFTSFFTNGAA
jgi:3',5'-cyclic AMP phosphodiesterase CpdA